MDLPDWLVPKQPPSTTPSTNHSDLPAWLTDVSIDPPEPTPSKEERALTLRRFEVAFPFVLDRIYRGMSLKYALNDYPIPFDPGMYMRWINSDPKRKTLYREAKEVRSEAWAGRMIELAEGAEENPIDLDRAKVAIDVYKWMISRENRKEYGDTKTIEMNTTISITAALEQANSRLIEATVIEDEDDNLALPPGQTSEDYE